MALALVASVGAASGVAWLRVNAASVVP